MLQTTLPALIVSLVLPTLVLANDDPSHLRKMYESAVQQLRVSQNRKNDLAQQNERLNAEIAKLKQQLAERDAEVASLQKQAAFWAQTAYELRVHLAAWNEFVTRWPGLNARWRGFLQTGIAEPPPGISRSTGEANVALSE